MADTPVAAAVAAVQNNQTPDMQTPAVAPVPNQANDVLMRKERQLRKLQQEIQAQRQSLDAKSKQYETDYVPKSRLKEDPWSVLEEQGLDYDSLTQQMLARPNDPFTKSLQAKLKAMEDRERARDEQAQQASQAQYETAKKQIANEVTLLVDSHADYETIKSEGMQEAVVELIEQEFNSTGVLMSTEDAAKQVEEHLINTALRLAQLTKIKSKLNPVVPEIEAPKKTPTNTQTITTLSQRMPSAPTTSMSQKDRIERAKLAFMGQLK